MHSPNKMLFRLLLLIGIGWIFVGQALEIEQCRRALGMESGRILDGQLSASSSFDPSTGPIHARLNTESGSGAWCPLAQINATSHEWIQVELAEETMITGIRTQGRWDKGRGLEFPSAYMIEYWRKSLGKWARYKDGQGDEIIRGNSDTQSAILRLLDGAILAKLIRIIPVSESIRTICLRFEVYGCPYKESLLSYSAPVGAFVDALDLRDSTFDGVNGGSMGDGQLNWQRNGLGKLFDGTVGEDNFEERPKGWIGWHRSQQQQIDPFVPLEFHFTRRQNLSAILFHTSNFRKRGARLFRSAKIHFAPFDNDEYSFRTFHWDVPEDSKFENARWLRIPIPQRIASRIRVELHFGLGADWLLLSEVRFESENAIGATESKEEDDLRPTTNLSTFIGYLAENDEAEQSGNEVRDGEEELATSANCLFQIAIFCGAILLASTIFCLCIFAITRWRRQSSKPAIKMFKNNSLAQSSCSSSSSYSSPPPSNFLLGQFLQNARRKMDSKAKFNENSQSNSLLKSTAGSDGDGKELMDIARLMMAQNGNGGGCFDGGEESDEYADPDAQCGHATIKASSSMFSPSSAGRPAQLQLHFSNRMRPNGLLLANNRRRIESPNASSLSSSYHRYRATPTLANFPPPIQLPPPLPPAPPPRRI